MEAHYSVLRAVVSSSNADPQRVALIETQLVPS
jgi:hypothetical protein